MTQCLWKQLLKTDFVFRELLSQLSRNMDLKKSDYENDLQTSSKYELIKMESDGLIELKDGKILLGECPEELMNIFYNQSLKSAV